MEETEVGTSEANVDIQKWNIYQRLHAMMADLDRIGKTHVANGLKYSFVAHDSVSSAVQPLLIKYRVLALSRFESVVQEGNCSQLRMKVDFINIDKPEDRTSVDSFGYGIDTQDKGPGKAISYAWKYALMKTLCMKTGDDPENDNIERGPRVERPVAVEPKVTRAAISMVPSPAKQTSSHTWLQQVGCITEGQSKLIYAKRKQANLVDDDTFKTYLKMKGWNNEVFIPKSELNEVIRYIESGSVNKETGESA